MEPPVTERFPSIVELFESKKTVTMCAPMVRYSNWQWLGKSTAHTDLKIWMRMDEGRLSFRMLVRKYGCDVAFTPMIVSHSFVDSIKARDNDFTICPGDRPLIAQFAAKNGREFADAAEIVYKYTDGVDLNCGCPQRWAMTDGYGACLLDNPEAVEDMIHQVHRRLHDPKYSVSLKIRLDDDIRKTVEFCKRAEKIGASFISVHGRTKSQRNEPVNLEAIKLIKENISIPVVGNGDVYHLKDVKRVQEFTKVDGVMSARGLLQNPSLFTGTDHVTKECIKDFVDISLSYGTTFTSFHHHLMFMLEHIMPKQERKLFNSYTSLACVIDHLALYL